MGFKSAGTSGCTAAVAVAIWLRWLKPSSADDHDIQAKHEGGALGLETRVWLRWGSPAACVALKKSALSTASLPSTWRVEGMKRLAEARAAAKMLRLCGSMSVSKCGRRAMDIWSSCASCQPSEERAESSCRVG